MWNWAEVNKIYHLVLSSLITLPVGFNKGIYASHYLPWLLLLSCILLWCWHMLNLRLWPRVMRCRYASIWDIVITGGVIRLIPELKKHTKDLLHWHRHVTRLFSQHLFNIYWIELTLNLNTSNFPWLKKIIWLIGVLRRTFCWQIMFCNNSVSKWGAEYQVLNHSHLKQALNFI